MEIYCVKCRKKQEVKEELLTEGQTKNGRWMKKGNCPVCNCKVNVFIKKVITENK